MELLGGIIKEATKLVYNKQKSQVDDSPTAIQEQHQLLYNMLLHANLTDFGIVHGFNEILGDPQFACSFSKKIPLTNYEMFYDRWLQHTLEGKSNVIWPGKIKYFALSSGTTKASSKRIPVTESMIRQFQKITKKQIIEIHELDLPRSVFESSVLLVGGSTKLKKVDSRFEGDLSGILIKNKTLLSTIFSKPGKKTLKIKDWNEKIDILVRKAPKWNIGVITGVPSWIALLMERIIEEYKLNSIHDIWPELTMVVHGGVFIEPHISRLEASFSKPVVYRNTFLASEGYFGYQGNSTEEGAMRLLTNEGIYYEFIEETYSDQIKNNLLDDIPTLTIDQVENGKNYIMVITTYSGLWRYLNGDIIQFKNVKKKEFKIIGRTSYSLNLAGEHLSEENLTKAIQLSADLLGVSINEFCVYPARNKQRHNWYIGSNQKVDNQKFSALLNHFLMKLNDDYATARKHVLKAPKVKSLPIQKFYEFMEFNNKLGGQNKFPRVMNEDQIRKWEQFLSNSDYELIPTTKYSKQGQE